LAAGPLSAQNNPDRPTTATTPGALDELLPLIAQAALDRPTTGTVPISASIAPARSDSTGTSSTQKLFATPDLPFRRIAADDIRIDGTTGEATLTGHATILGDELSAICDTFRADPQKKLATMKGAPVRLKLKDMDATCRDFVYNWEKNEFRLMGKVVIESKSRGKMEGDLFILTRNAEGNLNISIMQTPESDAQPTVIINESANAAVERPATPTETKPPEKIRENNLGAIPIVDK
jgi:hypothetical protein